MKKYVYLIHEGFYGDDGWVEGVYASKKCAVKRIKNDVHKYKYNKKDNLYYNDKHRLWYRIDRWNIERNMEVENDK